MDRRWKHIELSNWQRGLDVPLAGIGLEPSDLAERLGVEFADSRDELDLVKAALLKLESGKQYALVQHRGSADRGTTILANWFSPSLQADLEEVLPLLDLTRDDLTWIHDEIEGPGWILWREDDNGTRVPMRTFALRQAAEFARAEYEAKGHKQTYWIERSQGTPPRARSWVDPAVEFPLWEVWRGDTTGDRRRLNDAVSRALAERVLDEYRSKEPDATFWTAPSRIEEDSPQ